MRDESRFPHEKHSVPPSVSARPSRVAVVPVAGHLRREQQHDACEAEQRAGHHLRLDRAAEEDAAIDGVPQRRGGEHHRFRPLVTHWLA
jgi:hypothetical protein